MERIPDFAPCFIGRLLQHLAIQHRSPDLRQWQTGVDGAEHRLGFLHQRSSGGIARGCRRGIPNLTQSLEVQECRASESILGENAGARASTVSHMLLGKYHLFMLSEDYPRLAQGNQLHNGFYRSLITFVQPGPMQQSSSHPSATCPLPFVSRSASVPRPCGLIEQSKVGKSTFEEFILGTADPLRPSLLKTTVLPVETWLR